jgi:molybdopterin molybdotransferase
MGQTFKKLTKIEQVISQAIRHLKIGLNSENVYFADSQGRFLADDLISDKNIPSFRKSAVDGYAITKNDGLTASKYSPKKLHVSSTVKIGSSTTITGSEGICLKVPTVAYIPGGFDTVVPRECVNFLDNNKIEIFQSFAIGKNIIEIGQDVKKGQFLLKKGHLLNPFDIAMLAQIQKITVKVVEKLKIAILPTGNELVTPDLARGEYKTIDTNTYMLRALCKAPWNEIYCEKPIQDIVGPLIKSLKKLLYANHIVITIGGTSVGEFDLVSLAPRKLKGLKMMIRGVNIQPGRPTGIAVVDGKPIFMLSGFPVACAVGFMALVKPLLYKIIGTKEYQTLIVRAKLQSRISSSLGLKGYVRVKVYKKGRGFLCETIAITGSSLLSSLMYANGFVIVPPESEGYEKDTEVDVHMLRSME